MSVYGWYSKFSEDCKEVSNLLCAHVQPRAVCNVNICHVEEMILGKKANYSAWYCIQQWHSCWNNYPETLIIQESVCQVGLKEVNVWPEGVVCCFVCQTYALVWTGRKHISRVNNDLRWDMGALLHSNVRASERSSTEWGPKKSAPPRKLKDTSVSWQDHGKCVLGFKRDFFHMVQQLMHSITYLLHNVHQEIWKKWPGKLSKIIILLHDNSPPQMTNVTKATMGWEIMNHHP
jgi:hypothetical protein